MKTDDYLGALSCMIAQDLHISPSLTRQQICEAIHLAKETREKDPVEFPEENTSQDRYASLIYDDIFQTISELYLGHCAQSPLNGREKLLHQQIQKEFSKENCEDISKKIRAILADVEKNPEENPSSQTANKLSGFYETLISILCRKLFFYGVKFGRAIENIGQGKPV